MSQVLPQPSEIYKAVYFNLFEELTPAMKERVTKVQQNPDIQDKDVNIFAQKVIQVAETVMDGCDVAPTTLKNDKKDSTPDQGADTVAA